MKRFAAVFLVLCALFVLYPVSVNAAASTPIADFEYTRTDPGTVLLTKYIGRAQWVTVPESYFVDGATCRVMLDAQSVFCGNLNLESVTVCAGVTFANASMCQLFAKCEALRTVTLSMDTAGITDMSYLFYGCEALEKLDVSGWDTGSVTTMKGMFSNCIKLKKLVGYESWNTGSLRSIAHMFNMTRQLKTLDLSRWSLAGLENSAWCFQNCGVSKLLLPDDLAVISAGFLNHASSYTGSSFTIPAGVKKIGYAHTIYDFATDDFVEFRVAEGNTAYQAIDGILYSADGSQMLAIPRNKAFPDGVYQIPEGVTFLGELSFSRNYNIETVLLPDSYELSYIPLYDPAYIIFEDIGNLNSGLNLNIAIYCYTGIQSYQVKDTNPNYKSIDGVLYTKDGTSLVAVPSRYAGMLNIPEGVTAWNTAAMWSAGDTVDGLMKNCTGVHIPASMTKIARDQLEKLNRLESRFSGFKITISEDNPVYYLGRSGQLLERSNLEKVQITLQQDTFSYDTEPKEPAAVVTLEGKILRPEKDYVISYTDNVNAGTGWVRISGLGDYYGTMETSFSIEKSLPAYTEPAGVRAVYGQRLAEIPLPDGFVWMQPDTAVGAAGIHRYPAGYTSKDPSHLPVYDIEVTVTVDPRAVGSEGIAVPWWSPWTDSPVQPCVTVADQTGVIPAGEYTVLYENNRSFGKGRVILQDVPGGNYTVEGTAEFYIVPGPMLCTVLLTALWCMTTGVTLAWDKKGPPSVKLPKNR